MCSRQAATGSGSSSRTVARIASQRRATSGSPKACSAQPGVGKAMIVHGISPRSKACQYAWRSSGITERATRPASRPLKRFGSGSPTMLTNAARRSPSSLTFWSAHGGVQETASSGASSARERRR